MTNNFSSSKGSVPQNHFARLGKMVVRVKHLLGFHQWRGVSAVVTAENGVTFVLRWKQCDRCGASKVVFVYD
jgi:hypothetical protein